MLCHASAMVLATQGGENRFLEEPIEQFAISWLCGQVLEWPVCKQSKFAKNFAGEL